MLGGHLIRAAYDAKDLLGKLGRASTPAVIDRGLNLKTHYRAQSDVEIDFPVLFIGDSSFARNRGVTCLETHPNNLDVLLENPERCQALVTNARALGGPWDGALQGWAAWKSELIFSSMKTFKLAGLPVYLVEPRVSNAVLIRWRTVADAGFPGFTDTAEKTGNPHTQLWQILNNLDWEK